MGIQKGFAEGTKELNKEQEWYAKITRPVAKNEAKDRFLDLERRKKKKRKKEKKKKKKHHRHDSSDGSQNDELEMEIEKRNKLAALREERLIRERAEAGGDTCSANDVCTRNMSYPRTIWVVRHAEREDNINRKWRSLPGADGLASDNSMLSERGRTQAKECAVRFSKVNLNHVFASPYDRTIETASIIVGDKGLLVKPEPGLCEGLYMCENPPGFWEPEKLKKKFPLVDTDYISVFSKVAGDLMLVSHGAPIGAIHEIWMGDFKYVGQATVTKFVEVDKGKIRMEFSSDASHLSDKRNLRPW
ncbi:phosphoglycerate mutase family protein [Necator americanus]|uniref:Phosphoglycerate mutase family protein n=1 Tax=Necator americanus TaxID=51031 RepID=W2T0T9_NECAM|nr:phosphoglycerate mutase family protein [Necator americanus]ETN75513.1 phosphoglycerate mutase family protein [Necator americanus]